MDAYKKTPYNADQISIYGYQRGGFSLLSNEELPQLRLSIKALLEAGINGFTANELQQELGAKQVNIFPVIDEVSHGIAGVFSNKHAETGLQIIYGLMTGLNKNESVFEKYIKRLQSQTVDNSKDRFAYFSSEITKLINKDNPRVYYPPTISDWNTINYNTVYSAYRNLFSNANGMHFLLVGSIDEKSLEDGVLRYLGGLPSDLTKITNYQDLGYRPDFSPRRVTFNKGSEESSFIQLIIGGNLEDNDFDLFALRAIESIIKSKLLDTLRLRDAAVYSLKTNLIFDSVPFGHYEMSIFFPTTVAHVEDTLSTVALILKELVELGVSADELASYKKAAMIATDQQIQTNNYWINQLANYDIRNQPMTNSLLTKHNIESLTIEELRRVANKYLNRLPFIAALLPEAVK